jgi:hypothetical protein
LQAAAKKQQLRANKPNDMTCPLCMFVAAKVRRQWGVSPHCCECLCCLALFPEQPVKAGAALGELVCGVVHLEKM